MYPKEKGKKQKMLKMSLFIICEAPQKISTIFWPFLAIFTLFHLKYWPYLQKPEFCRILVYHGQGQGQKFKKML